jgi:hypothetical protein
MPAMAWRMYRRPPLLDYCYTLIDAGVGQNGPIGD